MLVSLVYFSKEISIFLYRLFVYRPIKSCLSNLIDLINPEVGHGMDTRLLEIYFT